MLKFFLVKVDVFRNAYANFQVIWWNILATVIFQSWVPRASCSEFLSSRSVPGTSADQPVDEIEKWKGSTFFKVYQTKNQLVCGNIPIERTERTGETQNIMENRCGVTGDRTPHFSHAKPPSYNPIRTHSKVKLNSITFSNAVRSLKTKSKCLSIE